MPIALKSRVVALLYGDDRESDVTVTQIGDLFGFAALVGKNLERIALAEKFGHAPPRVKAAPASMSRAVLAGARGAGVRPAGRRMGRERHPRPTARIAWHQGIGRFRRTTRLRTCARPRERLLAHAATELAPGARKDATRSYDERSIRSKGAMEPLFAGQSSRAARRDGAGARHAARERDEPATPRRARRRCAIRRSRREEDDDSSRWFVEEGGSPNPRRCAVSARRVRHTKYLIIPDRSTSNRPTATRSAHARLRFSVRTELCS